MRNALQEKVQEKLKNEGKQRMRQKMGKMDINYSILHDAFFKYQDKPKMTRIGEPYYEGELPLPSMWHHVGALTLVQSISAEVCAGFYNHVLCHHVAT